MKNRLFAIGAMILMMTSCTQDELISSDNGKEPATAGSCLTLVGLSSPQTRVSIGDKTGDVYVLLANLGDEQVLTVYVVDETIQLAFIQIPNSDSVLPISACGDAEPTSTAD